VLHGLRSATWRFNDPSRLRALLQTLARRRLASRFRHYRAAGERERTRAVIPDRVSAVSPSRPSEIAQANELWERMLAYCPPANHEVLRLRRNGLALAEIAARTGFHEGSVRRILRQLARRLSIESTAPTPDDCEGVRHES
jgi:DNA-directed RNA polymerase specialized sigma24 family protein